MRHPGVTASRRLRRPWPWTWSRRATAIGFLLLLYGSASGWISWFGGSMTGTRLLGIVPFTDPLAALEVTLASGDAHRTLLVGAASVAGMAVLLGPVFCGWICPLGLILDLNASLRSGLQSILRRTGKSLPEAALPRDLRYVVLGACVGFSLLGGLPAFQTISPINAVGWLVVYRLSTGLLLGVGALLVAEFFVPRVWCRALCPLGAVHGVLGRFARFRVWIDPAEAGRTACRRCTVSCPMGIAVMEDYALAGRRSVDDPACTRCGRCVEACPRTVLRLGVRPPRSRSAEPPPEGSELRIQSTAINELGSLVPGSAVPMGPVDPKSEECR